MSHTEDLPPALHKPLGSLLLRNATPAIAAMLMSALYQIVDGIMVGQRLGPHAIASINIIYPVIALLVGLAVMVGTGGNARIAVLLGRRRSEAARRILTLMTAMGILIGVTGTVVVLWFGSTLTAALGAAPEIHGMAVRYLLTLAPFFTGFILSFTLEQSLRNDGRGTLAGFVMGGAAVLNIVLDYVFLFPLDMGIAGAALASGISMTLSAVIFLTLLARPTGALWFTRFRLRSKTLIATSAAIAANGSSELFSALAMGVVTLLFNRTLMSISGSDGVAAFAIVQYLLMISAVFLAGLAAGGQPIIGQNYGAQLHHRVRHTVLLMIGAGMGTSVILLIAGRALAPAMARTFVPDHPDAVTIVTEALRMVSWALVVTPLGTLGSAYFTAVERPIPSLIIAALRSLVIPVVLLPILPLVMGTVGVWLIPVLSEGITAVGAVVMMVTSLRAGDDHHTVPDGDALRSA